MCLCYLWMVYRIFNPLRSAVFRKLFHAPDRIPDCTRIRAAMSYYNDSTNSQQRRTAIFRVVETLFDTSKRRFREHRTCFCHRSRH